MSPSGKIRATIGLQFNDVSSAGLLNRNAPGAIFLRHAGITQIMGKNAISTECRTPRILPNTHSYKPTFMALTK